MYIPLHPVQAEFVNCPALYRGFVGGRGSGKSWVGAYDLIRRARPGRTYLVASPTGVMMGDTTFPAFKALATAVGVWGEVRLTPYPSLTMPGGATVRFRTAEDPDKMRGPNLSGVWLDEASLMPAEAYTIAIGSLREAGEQGWLSATFTPKGTLHWTYERFGKSLPDTALFRARTGENPFNPPGFEATLAKQYSPMFALQELGGQFVALEGAEFPPEWFPESLWFCDWPPGVELRVVALDPSKGRTHHADYSAFILLAMTPDLTLWVEADLDRRPTTKIVSDGFALARRFAQETGGPINGFGVESDGFQEVLADEFTRQSLARKVSLPLFKLASGGVPKENRIRAHVTPHLSQGQVRFRDTPGTRLLVRQLMEFPVGAYVDGPDALAYARKLAVHLWNGKQAR